jgi:hypothetical protein
MIGLDGEHLLRDLAGAPLVGVGLVVRIGGGLKGQGVEDGRLAVLGVALVELLHGLGVGGGPRAVVELVGVLEEEVGGRDVVTLAIRPGPGRLRLVHGLHPALEGGGGRGRPDLRPLAERHAPVRHAAARIGLGDGREGLRRLEIPERMQERDRALEGLLHGGGARHGEDDLADLLAGRRRHLRGERHVPEREQGRGEDEGDDDHGGSRHGNPPREISGPACDWHGW